MVKARTNGPVVSDKVEPAAKKRGRKPKANADNVPAPETPETTSEPSSEEYDGQTPIIVHLNVPYEEGSEKATHAPINGNFEEDFCRYDPAIVVPNAYDDNSNFASHPYELQTNDTDTSSENMIIVTQHTDEPVPFKSYCACYWCCHTFDTRALGMPVKYKNNRFHVTGVFCSLECACAYNFDTCSHVNNMWDTYNMINLMARYMEYVDFVYPAPPRKCLRMFGGKMTIEEFRSQCKSNKIISFNHCPLVASVDQVEEINNFYHKHRNSDELHIDTERLRKYENKLKLQQNSFIMRNFENTLDKKMGIVS